MTGEAEPSVQTEIDDPASFAYEWVKIDGDGVSWELRGVDGSVIALVTYRGNRRWRGSYNFAGRQSWCEVGSTFRARRWIENQLWRNCWQWEGCSIVNPVL